MGRFPVGCEVQTSYPTGDIRPFCRGWLHFIEAALLLWLLFSYVSTFPLLLHHLGKFASCAASAVLHLRPHRTVSEYATASAADCACILVSIFAGLVGWVDRSSLIGHLAIAVLAASAVGITSQRWAVARLGGDFARAERLFSVQLSLTGLYFFWNAFIGIGAGLSSSWLGTLPGDLLIVATSLGLYVAGFMLYTLRPSLPWHSPAHWVAHEDFHALLLLADLSNYFVLRRHGNL